MSRLGVCAVLVVLCLLGSSVQAATFVVNTTNSDVDATPGDGQCRTAGMLCSLRAAVMEANALAGVDTINFNIAPGGVVRIPLAVTVGGMTSSLTITDSVTIDGSTQPGFSNQPLIEVNCANAFNGFIVNASNVQIRNIAFTGFPQTGLRLVGDQIFLQRVWFGQRLDTLANVSNGRDVVIEGDGARIGEGRFSGNGAGVDVLPGANDAWFVDSFFDVFTIDPACTFVGNPLLDLRGSGHRVGPGNVFAPGNAAAIRADATSNSVVVGNFIGQDENGNLLCAGTGRGVEVFNGSLDIDSNSIGGLNNDAIALFNASGVQVHGNQIGINALGAAAGNDGDGLRVEGSDTVVVGRRADGSEHGNVIGGSTGAAVSCLDSELSIVANALGTDFGGLFDLGNADAALDVDNCQVYSDHNHYAKSLIGVRVNGANSRFNSLGDVFSGNLQLPLDLNGDGPTANDPGDGDVGPNSLQNTVESAMVADSYVEFDPGMHFAPGTYSAMFYGAESCDRLIGGVAYGDGRFIGGEHVFTISGSGAPVFQRWATAIRFAYWIIKIRNVLTGATSELSRCFRRDGGFLGDRVWRDYNRNGLQDQREPGIAGITVTLLDGAGTAIDTRLTGPDGRYRFADLATGIYRLRFSLAPAHSYTTVDAGPDDIDSDAIVASGTTAPFAYTFGSVDPSRDCGQIPDVFLDDFGELRSGP